MPMSTPGDPAVAVVKLREAVALVEQHAPEEDARQRRDKIDILRRLGLLIANLRAVEVSEVCRRCQATFTYNPAWFALHRLEHVPRHCDACRKLRRDERRGITTHNVPDA